MACFRACCREPRDLSRSSARFRGIFFPAPVHIGSGKSRGSPSLRIVQRDNGLLIRYSLVSRERVSDFRFGTFRRVPTVFRSVAFSVAYRTPIQVPVWNVWSMEIPASGKYEGGPFLLAQVGQAEMLGQGGRQEWPGIGHQAVIVEGDADAVGGGCDGWGTQDCFLCCGAAPFIFPGSLRSPPVERKPRRPAGYAWLSPLGLPAFRRRPGVAWCGSGRTAPRR